MGVDYYAVCDTCKKIKWIGRNVPDISLRREKIGDYTSNDLYPYFEYRCFVERHYGHKVRFVNDHTFDDYDNEYTDEDDENEH